MRRTKDFKITAVDRDEGKIFQLTEMSAFAAEKFAAKVILALMKSGVKIPENVKDAGLAGLATIAISAFGGIHPDVLMPLLDEMMDCVKIISDPRNPQPRPLVPEDIDEVATLLTLRKELLELHLGFSLAAKLSNLMAEAATEEASSLPTT
jgi:hypothetical protein